jgi:Domain of unknown function (DUF4178)
VLTAVLVAMVLGSGAYAAWALRRGQQAKPRRVVTRGPGEARTHDVITHMERDWLVEGVLQLGEAGRRRRLARLVDGSEVAWLLSGDGELALLFAADDAAPPLPPPDTLRLGADTFRLTEAGGGRVARHGDVGPRAMDRCRYWRYAGPGNRRAWVDEFRGAALLVGETIPEMLLDLLPGS